MCRLPTVVFNCNNEHVNLLVLQYLRAAPKHQWPCRKVKRHTQGAAARVQSASTAESSAEVSSKMTPYRCRYFGVGGKCPSFFPRNERHCMCTARHWVFPLLEPPIQRRTRSTVVLFVCWIYGHGISANKQITNNIEHNYALNEDFRISDEQRPVA